MATTIRAVFDGEVLRPERPLRLRAATTYVITVEGEAPAEAEAPNEDDQEEPYALSELGRLAMDMGVEDFSGRHDWYAHGRLPDETP